MQNIIRFGPSGNSNQFYEDGNKHTFQAAAWVAAQSLNAFEYSFGRGVRMGDDTAAKIAGEMKKYDIALSVHAPYFINYANIDDQKIQNSHNYVLQSVRAAQAMGGNRVVMHSGVQSKGFERDFVLKRIADGIKDMLVYLDENTDGNYIICPETMGKYSQVGSYNEVFDLCLPDKRLIPCIDFGHVNCVMQGALKTVDDFKHILETGINKLGLERMQSVHVHFNKIEFGKVGEIRHLTYADTKYGPNFEPFAQAIHDMKLTPVVICESDGTQAHDVSLLAQYYRSIA